MNAIVPTSSISNVVRPGAATPSLTCSSRAPCTSCARPEHSAEPCGEDVVGELRDGPLARGRTHLGAQLVVREELTDGRGDGVCIVRRVDDETGLTIRHGLVRAAGTPGHLWHTRRRGLDEHD